MQLRHTMISASAGSGKTYQLVRRYLHLMVCGAKPESIAAMTFTRKAAGEFFNRILNRLSELADGKIQPSVFFQGMEPQPAQWPDFKEMLRETTQNMHRLRLGTMDSFFGTICACFPLELGLPLGATVIPEEDEEKAHEQTLRSLIHRVYQQRDETALSTLLEAFKSATFGAQEKGALKQLMGWIDEGHGLWLEGEVPHRWGNPHTIWPPTASIHQKDLPQLSQLPQQLDAAIRASTTFTEEAEVLWEQIISNLHKYAPGLKLPYRVDTIVDKAAAAWEELKQGSAEITLNRKKTTFAGEAADALLAAMRTLLAYELLVRSKRTRGVAELLGHYEKEYAQQVRGAGQLSFSDVQRLLGCAAEHWLTENEGTELWYRLDSRYQHWLLDEFQDTSFLQWRVMRGLMAEVLQSEDADRSFFAVGDLKQSIYLWRNAEPGLFSKIQETYPDHAGRGIQVQQLSKSYRSSQQVLDFVNAVLGDKAKISQLLPEAAQQWHFQPHVTDRKELQGYAGFFMPASSAEEEEEADAKDLTLELLKELRPIQRGLSCAILMAKNDRGIALAERIRSELGMEVVCESKEQPLVDNPVTLALLSLLQLAAHPTDRFAYEHLKMTPLFPTGTEPRDTLLETQRLLLDSGFLSWVALWSERIQTQLGPQDEFTLHRLEQMADLAAEIDASGSRDIDAFIQSARAHTLRTRGASQAIQVMTIHASKGLEFDVVILPDISGKGLPTLKPRPFLSPRDEEGSLQWVLQPPVTSFVTMDEVLSSELKEAESKSAFEGLCRFYVAMTRAKRSLYLIGDKPPKKATSITEAYIMRKIFSPEEEKPKRGKKAPKPEVSEPSEKLGPIPVQWLGEQGDRHWYQNITDTAPAPGKTPPAQSLPLGALLRSRQPMARRRTPSGEESFVTLGRALFTTGRDHSKELGTLVHEMLSHIQWVDEQLHDDADILSLLDQHGYTAHAAYEKALPHVLRAVRSGAFTRPSAPWVKLWRERPFDVMLESNDWITGTFDRVVVTESQAHILDFKTDDLSAPGARAEKVKGYTPQLALYRQAVSRLTGLPLHRIHCTLVFTRLDQDALQTIDLPS